MKRGAVLSFGVSLVFSFALVGAGCSSDDTTPPKQDAGKKDTGSATGGSGGKGGTSGSGGRTGSGGTSGRGGSGGSGGTTGQGGSSSAGGSSGTGGATGGGGAMGGSGGGSGGTGGTQVLDGGSAVDGSTSMDATTSDAIDAPLPGLDAAAEYDVAGSDDTGSIPMLDSGMLDTQGLDSGVDTSPVHLDSAIDTTPMDVANHDVAADMAADTAPLACPSVNIPTGSNTGNFNTAGIYCFATCDDISQWGASNLDGRTVKVNGTTVTVPANGGNGGQMPLPAKYLGTYYVFEVSAGTYTWAQINWNGTAHTCLAPDGGFPF